MLNLSEAFKTEHMKCKIALISRRKGLFPMQNTVFVGIVPCGFNDRKTDREIERTVNMI